MHTKSLGPGFAVEVGGFDPSGPITAEAAAELRTLLDTHQLLVLRAPGLDADAQLRIMRVFGPIYDEACTDRGYSHVSNVFGSFPSGRLLFHQDFAFTAHPHEVQSLYAEEVTGSVAPTLFISNLQAYDRLTPEQRAAWEGLTAVHARNATRSGQPDDEFVRIELRKLPDSDNEKRYPRGHHPVIGTHPRTGQPMLFANEYHMSHILELPPKEGEKVIQEAIAGLYDPATIYAHDWQPGDLILWDNIALQHARSAVKPDTRRTLRRMLVNEHFGAVAGTRQAQPEGAAG